MYRIITLLIFWTILQGCKVYTPTIDVGKHDLFSAGLSPDYNNTTYTNYILKVQPEQIFRDTIFRHITSRAFTSVRQKDGAIGLEKPNFYPADNWDAYLNNKGYIITKKSFASNTDTVWNVDSFAYVFEKSKPIQIIEYSSRFRTEDIKYFIDYNHKGQIHKITIVNHRDSLIVQRTYHYSFRKLLTYTINGKRDTIQHEEYVFSKNNKLIEQTAHLILKGTIKKSKLEYTTDSTFKEKWSEFDKNKQIVATGFVHYLNDLAIETESDFYGNWKHKNYFLNLYKTDRSILKTTHIFSSATQADTSVTTYTYENNLENRNRRTVVQLDCSKCKSCGNCEFVNAVVVKYD
jgi:uncharacterized protein YuzE